MPIAQIAQSLPYATVDTGCEADGGGYEAQYACIAGQPGGLPVPGKRVRFKAGVNGPFGGSGEPTVICPPPVYPNP